MLENVRISRIAVSLSRRQYQPSRAAMMPKFPHARKLVADGLGRLRRACSALPGHHPATVAAVLVARFGGL
jgi:hypothetical protein